MSTRPSTRHILLSEIAAQGPIARIDLAQMTGISRATVTAITADLLREGLIGETQTEGHSARGRPRVDLSLRADAHVVMGVKISDQWMSMMLMDFQGNERAVTRAPMPGGRQSPDALAAQIDSAIADMLTAHGLNRRDLSAVGIGMAGIVDASMGHVHWSPSLNLRNVDFAELVEAMVGAPVVLDNDANLVALAERRFGLGRGHDSFVVVTIEAGVGTGIILGGQLYRGTRGCGAEFGHTKVQLQGALCRCGQRGCLEAYVADYALEREARTLLGADADLGALMNAADHSPAAASIIERAGQMFALGLANLVNLLDPGLIILAGDQTRFNRLYADAVLTEMRKSIVEVDTPPPDVVVHGQGDEMWARGAAAYALDLVMDTAAEGEPAHAT